MLRRNFLAAMLAAAVAPEVIERLMHRKVWALDQTQLIHVPLSHWREVRFALSEVEFTTELLRTYEGEAVRALARQWEEEIDARVAKKGLTFVGQRAVRAVARQNIRVREWYDPLRAARQYAVETLYGFPGEPDGYRLEGTGMGVGVSVRRL